jgi:ribose/xylose/arabinose/galactoside ABC-type transport system permease subunit
LIAHIVWEGLLLVAAFVVTALGVAEGHFYAGGGPWPQLAIIGLLAAALALSLRTGTPNLAVGALVPLGGLLYVRLMSEAGWSALPAAAVAVLAALGFGLVLALVVGLTGAPAWAVSLGGLALATAVGLANGSLVYPLPGRDNPSGTLNVFAAVFVVGSIAAGVLWLLPGMRSLTVAGDAGPGRRVLAALVGLGGSSLLAGLAGVLEAERLASANFVGGDTLLLLALGAALLGGVSLAGRGGGITGTVLAAFLLVGTGRLVTLYGGPVWLTFVLTGVAIVVGALVSRLFDWLGTRTPATRPIDQDFVSLPTS